MRTYALRLLALAALAALMAPGARGQTLLTGDYVQINVTDTGQLVSSGGTGIMFRPTTGDIFREMIVSGSLGAEGWTLDLNGTLITNGDGYIVGGPIVTSGNGPGTRFHRTGMSLSDTLGGSAMVQLDQLMTFDQGDKRVRFDVTLQNLTGQTLEWSYLRTVNPLQGLDALPAPVQGPTQASNGAALFPEGVAADSLNSTAPAEFQRHLALATDTVGGRVNSGGNAKTNFDGFSVFGHGYIELISTGPVASNTVDVPFPGLPGEALNFWMANLGALAPQSRAQFTFYYVFDGPVGQEVPEPGALSLFGGLAVAGVAFLRRRRV